MSNTAPNQKEPSDSNDESILQFLKNRLLHRFLSWYICSWVLWNWEVFAILSGADYPIGYRIAWVKEVIYGADAGRRWEPITMAIAFGVPWFAAIALKPAADFFIIIRRQPENWVRAIDAWFIRRENRREEKTFLDRLIWRFRVKESPDYKALVKERDDLAAKLAEQTEATAQTQYHLDQTAGRLEEVEPRVNELFALVRKSFEAAVAARNAIKVAINAIPGCGPEARSRLPAPLKLGSSALENLIADPLLRELGLVRDSSLLQPPSPESSLEPTPPRDRP